MSARELEDQISELQNLLRESEETYASTTKHLEQNVVTLRRLTLQMKRLKDQNSEMEREKDEKDASGADTAELAKQLEAVEGRYMDALSEISEAESAKQEHEAAQKKSHTAVLSLKQKISLLTAKKEKTKNDLADAPLPMCESCHKNQAIIMCNSCDKKYCSDCNRSAHKTKETRMHSRAPIPGAQAIVAKMMTAARAKTAEAQKKAIKERELQKAKEAKERAEEKERLKEEEERKKKEAEQKKKEAEAEAERKKQAEAERVLKAKADAEAAVRHALEEEERKKKEAAAQAERERALKAKADAEAAVRRAREEEEEKRKRDAEEEEAYRAEKEKTDSEIRKREQARIDAERIQMEEEHARAEMALTTTKQRKPIAVNDRHTSSPGFSRERSKDHHSMTHHRGPTNRRPSTDRRYSTDRRSSVDRGRRGSTGHYKRVHSDGRSHWGTVREAVQKSDGQRRGSVSYLDYFSSEAKLGDVRARSDSTNEAAAQEARDPAQVQTR
jgi:hypothetical protein